MAAVLAKMTAYLESLPRGIDSYPDYTQKAALYRESLVQLPPRGLVGLAGLPGPVAQLIERPEPVSNWVPEVWATALSLAISDAHFPDDEDFLASKLETNRRVLKGPMYRLLMMVVSPSALLRHTAVRWAKFHRGLPLRITQLSPGAATWRLDFPVYLVPALIARTYAVAAQAALEAAGGKKVRCVLASSGPTFALYEGTWS